MLRSCSAGEAHGVTSKRLLMHRTGAGCRVRFSEAHQDTRSPDLPIIMSDASAAVFSSTYELARWPLSGRGPVAAFCIMGLRLAAPGAVSTFRRDYHISSAGSGYPLFGFRRHDLVGRSSATARVSPRTPRVEMRRCRRGALRDPNKRSCFRARLDLQFRPGCCSLRHARFRCGVGALPPERLAGKGKSRSGRHPGRNRRNLMSLSPRNT